MKPTIYYAQNREDIIIYSFFPDLEKGFYVDIGAYHPIDDSVTQFFYDRGWSGVNIEPQPEQYKLFQKKRKRDKNLNIAISDVKGTLKLRQYESAGLSTVSDKIKKDYTKSRGPAGSDSYTEYAVKVDTLRTVLKDTNEIQFLKIDVEGYEAQVIKSNDWDTVRPELLCIEANHVVGEDWSKLLLSSGYELVFFDGLNEYYLRKESIHRKKLFLEEFPKRLIESPLLSYEWETKINELLKRNDNYEQAVQHYKKESLKQAKKIELQHKTITELNQELNSIRKLLSRLVGRTKSRAKEKIKKK